MIIAGHGRYDAVLGRSPRYLYNYLLEKDCDELIKNGFKSGKISDIENDYRRMSITTSIKRLMINVKELNFIKDRLNIKYCVIRIDTEKIPDYFRVYKTDIMYLHKCFEDFNEYYTYNTIPTNAIEKII